MAVHPPVRDMMPVSGSISSTIARVELGGSGLQGSTSLLFTVLESPSATIAPGAEHALDVGVYAGPLDRHILNEQPYDALSMAGMIIYSMSGCCTWLTFQWLAHLLLWFLGFLHDYVVFDWGLAIIGLVCVVRTLLHPLTKKSQINMQRFGKQMQALKPEIDKLQKKFGSDPKRMQAEQMKLMREHGVNPLQMLGCLPMFLQMPIWIALWAMLYLAWDIHQQPAFYGVFQLLGNWPFLADLSSQDNFIPLGAGFAIPLVGWHVSAINLLPLLMGLVFFVQQKYMTPPQGPNVTPEMKQQQAIMKWMLVLMMPLIMYKAPSGLTLYIMTSSIIGILESRYVRRHIEQLDLAPATAGNRASKPKGAIGRAWAERLEALKQRQAQRSQEQQQRSFKKRK
jgi:YidC/Oxa1 family membrane protein insertase